MLEDIKTLIKRRAPLVASVYRLAHSYWTGRRWIGKGMRAFSEIYKENVWNESESASGRGSSLKATEALRAALPRLLVEHDIHSILDAPCGDAHWMSVTALGGRSYTGVDIVPELVQTASRLHAQPDRRFLCLDISKDDLPKADLIISRDSLVHFSYADILATLRNFKRSGARFLCTTTFPDHTFNKNIPTGHWRPINLLLPPFSLPKPLYELREDPKAEGFFADKSFALWDLDSLSL